MYTTTDLPFKPTRKLSHSIIAPFELRDVFLIGVQGVQKAVVGVDRLPGQLPENLALFPYKLLQTTEGPAVELGVIIERFDPVLEEPSGEPHAALLRLESLVHGGLVPLAGEPVQSLRGIPVSPRVSLVHYRPPSHPYDTRSI